MAEIIVREDGPIGRVIFSNPAKFNAMSQTMWEALPGAIERLDANPAIRLLVLEGDGEKAFVSGADISQFESQRTEKQAQQRYSAAVDAAYLAPVLCSKPVIAKIRGVCMGGGLGLAAACDIRICAEGSRFRMPAGRLGLGYGIAGVRRFLSILGAQNTMDIFFSARIFSADDALRMGFVREVAPRDSFDAVVQAYCDQLAENAPLTLAALKRTVTELLRDPAERDLDAVSSAIAACGASDDYREGALAFMEKRAPRFNGR